MPRSIVGASLRVAIFRSLPFDHWALVIKIKYSDGSAKFVTLHVTGGGGQSFQFEERESKKSPLESRTYLKQVRVGKISASRIKKLKEAAANFDEDIKPGWNCQDYVMELLIRIRGKGRKSTSNITKATLKILKEQTRSLAGDGPENDDEDYPYIVDELDTDDDNDDDEDLPLTEQEGKDVGYPTDTDEDDEDDE